MTEKRDDTCAFGDVKRHLSPRPPDQVGDRLRPGPTVVAVRKRRVLPRRRIAAFERVSFSRDPGFKPNSSSSRRRGSRWSCLELVDFQRSDSWVPAFAGTTMLACEDVQEKRTRSFAGMTSWGHRRRCALNRTGAALRRASTRRRCLHPRRTVFARRAPADRHGCARAADAPAIRGESPEPGISLEFSVEPSCELRFAGAKPTGDAG